MKGIILLRVQLILLCSLLLCSAAVSADVEFSSPAANDSWYQTHSYDICWTRTADTLPPLSLSVEQASGAGERYISTGIDSTALAQCFSWGVYHDLPQVSHRFCLRGTVNGVLQKQCSEAFSILAPTELSADSDEVNPDPRDETKMLTYKARLRVEGPDIPDSTVVQFKAYGPGRTELVNVKKTLALSNSTTPWFNHQYRVPQWGLYRNELIVDSEGTARERNEANNKLVTLYAVDPKPDLQVYVDPDIRSVAIHKRRGIRAYVKNVGDRKSPESTLRFWIEGKGGKSYPIPKLQPGKTWSVKREPKWALGGTKTFRVTVDPDKQLDELSYNNNAHEDSVFVKGVIKKFDKSGLAAPPDLRVRIWMPKMIKRGKSTPVLIEVRNLGKSRDHKAENITLTTTVHGVVSKPQGQWADLVKRFDIAELLPGEKHIIVQNIETSRPVNRPQRFSASVRTSAGKDRNKGNNQLSRQSSITN